MREPLRFLSSNRTSVRFPLPPRPLPHPPPPRLPPAPQSRLVVRFLRESMEPVHRSLLPHCSLAPRPHIKRILVSATSCQPSPLHSLPPWYYFPLHAPKQQLAPPARFYTTPSPTLRCSHASLVPPHLPLPPARLPGPPPGWGGGWGGVRGVGQAGGAAP